MSLKTLDQLSEGKLSKDQGSVNPMWRVNVDDIWFKSKTS